MHTPLCTRHTPVLTGIICTALTCPAGAATFTEALVSGKPELDLRLRYENVDQDNPLENADAFTLRTRLGYRTGTFRDFAAFVEMENTTAILGDDYNSTRNGKVQYSTVADPEVTEVNQSYLDYSGLRDTLIRAGRQRIVLDNARFVGNVGWRQNEQTYTGALLSNQSLPDTVLTYAYLDEIKDISGNATDVHAHLLNASYAGLGFGTLTGYGYLIEFRDSPLLSQQTWGLRLAGATELSGFKLLYTAEFARQSDYKDGNDAIDADYRLLEIGAEVSGITGKVGYELLGADNAFSFETPLATKHAFNGWADVFLNTPDGQGLEDIYVLASGGIAGVKLTAVYHDFQADTGGADFGTELDLLAAKKFGKHYAAGIKYASYDADTFAVDTDKFWLWGEVSF
ncbi:MAG: alginate export family protein [Pseudomonadota bacterium]